MTIDYYPENNNVVDEIREMFQLVFLIFRDLRLQIGDTNKINHPISTNNSGNILPFQKVSRI